MSSIERTNEEVEITKKEIANIRQDVQNLNLSLVAYGNRLDNLEKVLYRKNIRLLHIKEIYRLAKQQFSRLRESEEDLSEADITELEKWIGRAKSDEGGLIDIIEALQELRKYLPTEIKSNLYALIQKIIIGGAWKKTK